MPATAIYQPANPIPSSRKPWSRCSAASSDPSPLLNFRLPISSCQTSTFYIEGIELQLLSIIPSRINHFDGLRVFSFSRLNNEGGREYQ